VSGSARRVPPTAVAGLVLVALVAVLLAWQRPWGGDDAAPVGDQAQVETALRSQLAALAAAADEPAWTEGFGSGGATVASATWRARDALGVADVDLDLVSLADAPDRTDGSRAAVVRISWTSAPDARLGAAGDATAVVGLRLRASAEGDGVDLLGVEPRTDGPDPDPVPLWLAGEVTVGGDGPVALVTVATPQDGGPAVPEAPSLVAAAVAQIERVTGTSDPAAVVVPASGELAARLLGRGTDGLGAVAGVTTTAAGIGVPVVVLNPTEFERMDQRGRQVVVTHELTHAMTGAVGTSAETWLVEGFADWVALHDDTAPLTTSAGQLLLQVASSGAPAALPTDDDLAGSTSSAAYQGAWLAVVVLGRDQGGDAAVLQAYRAVIGGATVDEALGDVGSSVDELTTRWQDYLTYSASTVS